MVRVRLKPLPRLTGEPSDLARLTAWEKIAYDLIVAAAEAARPAPTSEDLQEVCDYSLSTAVRIVDQLEQRGLITVERYQRSRRMKVIATGKRTAAVKNKTPHWRTAPRPASMPAPSLAKVQARTPDFARDVMRAARAERMELGEFLAELAWAGWQQREASIQGESSEG